MSDDTIGEGIPAIIEAARAQKGAEVVDILGTVDMSTVEGFPLGEVPMLVTYDHDGGQQATSVLDEVERWRKTYASRPQRREGTIITHDLATFIAATNRDKRPDTVLFADTPAKKLTAILDFHGPADSAPRFCKDRIEYGFQFSQQFIAWIQASKAPMDQRAFSLLIDNRIADINSEPIPEGSIAAAFAARLGIRFATIADLLVFTRTIAAKSTTESEEQIDENTGDISIQYKKRGDVKTPDGKPVPVPQAFALSIPVLNGLCVTEYNIAVRLRYDIGSSGIAWRIELHALDKYIEAAIKDAVAAVRKDAPEGCGLPVFMGAAPAIG